MKIRIVNNSNNPLPEYASLASAGADLRANLEQDIQLKPMERTMVPTGIFIEIPRGHEAQIRPRSGLAVKKGVTVLNSPGTIDADYRGEVKIILINLSNETTTIKPGERIAQMIISRHEQAEWVETDELDKTQRGTGGFGSTGQD